MAIAFFDLDGTLTKTDTFIPYCLVSLVYRPWRVARVGCLVRGMMLYLKGRVSRDTFKELFVKVFLEGADKSSIERCNRIFLTWLLPGLIRPSIFAKLQEHRERGDRVYIVSASPDVYVEAIAEKWKIDGVLCTRLEWSNGRLTGSYEGKNCRGREKEIRIRECIHHVELAGSYAYGNSKDDLDMLNLADNRVYLGK